MLGARERLIALAFLSQESKVLKFGLKPIQVCDVFRAYRHPLIAVDSQYHLARRGEKTGIPVEV